MFEGNVIKRNGKRESFKLDKIENAISNAAYDTHTSDNILTDELALEVGNVIYYDFFDKGKEPTVEEVQDVVEDVLVDNNLKEIAKSYMLYREERHKRRSKDYNNSALTKDFLSKYKHTKNPFGSELGKFVFYRTYSRWLDDVGRREYLWESVKRAIEYNTSLLPTSKEETRDLYDAVFNFDVFVSGRMLYTGGTDVSKMYSMQNFNCSFAVLDRIEAFLDCFILSMLGSGFGFRVLFEDVAKLPSFKTDIEITHKYYEPVRVKEDRQEYSNLQFDKSDKVVTITIGDSKEGWLQSLRYYFEILTSFEYKKIERIIFNYDNVRPKGEKLETFGGTASGHQSLKRMFTKINIVLDNRNKDLVDLRPIDAMDIANIIAENVVSGGVRRSSQLCLFSANDELIKNAKSNLYKQVDGEWKIDESISHRQMSNNSIMYWDKPSKEELKNHIQQLRYSGEPGFINAEEATRRFKHFKGVNPCAEILLDSMEVCNLTSLNTLNFVDENGNLDRKRMLKAQRLSARAGYRMTSLKFELNDWDKTNQRDRLIGCSLTGWQDMCNKLGWGDSILNIDNYFYSDLPKGQKKQIELLKELKEAGKQAAEEIAEENGTPVPEMVTTVKPEGSYTQMPTTSSGLHYNHSEYFVRRVRVSGTDPLAFACEELGFNVKPEVGHDPDNPDTVVVEFPIKAPTGKTKSDVSAIEQLNMYKMFMRNYVDHNASITVHVREHEWEEVEEWLYNNWDDVVGISFLSYNDSFYDLMPYESISKEEYKEMLSNTPKLDTSIINKHEKFAEKVREVEDSSCDSGLCPVR